MNIRQTIAAFSVATILGMVVLATPADAEWQGETYVDDFDDTKIHRLKTTAPIINQYGQEAEGSLLLYCFTKYGDVRGLQVAIYFGGYFMSDHDGYGTVHYRVDKNDSRSVRFFAPHGDILAEVEREARTFMRDLLLQGGSELRVRATPYRESPVTMRFDISGFEEKIRPLAEGCNAPNLILESRAEEGSKSLTREQEREARRARTKAIHACREKLESQGFSSEDAHAQCIKEIPPVIRGD